jgi:hypothetical protein
MSFSLGSSGFERVFLQTQRPGCGALQEARFSADSQASLTNRLLGALAASILSLLIGLDIHQHAGHIGLDIAPPLRR